MKSSINKKEAEEGENKNNHQKYLLKSTTKIEGKNSKKAHIQKVKKSFFNNSYQHFS